MSTTPKNSKRYFYPRPPGGGRRVLLCVVILLYDFYPRPPGGGRLAVCGSRTYKRKFLSTPSGWRATSSLRRSYRIRGNFYPRPPGGGRRVESGSAFAHVGISIHALRVEGDVILRHNRDKPFPFLSTPSGWRATIMQKLCDRMGVQFLSTPSGWRATRTLYWLAILSIFLSTPSGWRATF